MIARFYFPQDLPAAGAVLLPEALAHHAVRVLRLRDGAAVVLFDGSGAEVDARLQLRGREVGALLGARRRPRRESALAVELVQALPAGDKMDWVVQKAVELGAHAIQPLQAERSVLRLSGERAQRRLAHWRQIAIAACEQCGRNEIPLVHELLDFNHWLAAARGTHCYVLAPDADYRLGDGAAPDGLVRIVIGPEGGWSEAELKAFRAAGCVAARLGPRVLRTETAGLAALAVLQARWGDF